MAIEIIPKEEIKPSPWQKILLYIVVFLLLLSIAGYFLLDYYFIEKANQEIQDLETKISEAKTPQQIALEEELKSYQKKIDDFSSLFAKHKKGSNFFDFLEKNTHPKVYFSELSLNIKGNQVNLSGQTESFKILGEQLLIFRNADLIQDLKLSKVGSSEEGKIEFTFIFSLKPQLFQ